MRGLDIGSSSPERLVARMLPQPQAMSNAAFAGLFRGVKNRQALSIVGGWADAVNLKQGCSKVHE
jgi:hypothetical protein